MKRVKNRAVFLLILVVFILTAWDDATQIYEVEKGDTLSEIAFQFGLSMEQIQAANPKVDFSLLKIGDELVIPPVNAAEYDTFIQSMYSKYIQYNGSECISQLFHQISCLSRIKNSGDQSVINLQMQLEVADGSGKKLLLSSGSPLIQLSPGEEIPVLFTGFNSELSAPFETRFQVKNLDVADYRENSFCIAADSMGNSYEISPDGLCAKIQIRFASDLDIHAFNRNIKIVAAVYRKDGTPAGIRTWIGNVASEINMSVYSLSGKIESVKIWAEYY